MKKAKVSKGLVQHVWPFTDENGKLHELPLAYQGANGKEVPDCIVDVPDEVQRNWVWDGEKYTKRVKLETLPARSHVVDVIAEKLGITYDELMAEVQVKAKAYSRMVEARKVSLSNVVAEAFLSKKD